MNTKLTYKLTDNMFEMVTTGNTFNPSYSYDRFIKIMKPVMTNSNSFLFFTLFNIPKSFWIKLIPGGENASKHARV